MSIEQKRKQNERKFGSWDELTDKGRRYFYDVQAKDGFRSARYVKEVDGSEQTLRFYQEIYDDNGKLEEIHEKYPADKGHIKVQER